MASRALAAGPRSSASLTMLTTTTFQTIPSTASSGWSTPISSAKAPPATLPTLDYAHEVRDLYLALIGETLDRYDIDGLSWTYASRTSSVREAEGALYSPPGPGHARAGDSRAPGPSGAVSVRASRPETAKVLGLDTIAWARRACDLAVPAPRWVYAGVRHADRRVAPSVAPLPEGDAIGRPEILSSSPRRETPVHRARFMPPRRRSAAGAMRLPLQLLQDGKGPQRLTERC